MSQSNIIDMAEVKDTKLYYEGTGTRQVVVFIHGFTLDTRMGDDQIEYSAQHYQVIRYDLRGFGKSAVQPTKSIRMLMI